MGCFYCKVSLIYIVLTLFLWIELNVVSVGHNVCNDNTGIFWIEFRMHKWNCTHVLLLSLYCFIFMPLYSACQQM